jgi:hypothetical protein
VAWTAFDDMAAAQPTYKLDVKAHLMPQATLRLDGSRIARSAVKDDPGFRLQYHFRKDGKTIATIEARSKPAQELPLKEPGSYTVVLELFYPGYKGGSDQKGTFKPISNLLTYRIEPGPSLKVTLIQAPAGPALAIHCGKANGTQNDQSSIAMGYSYKLLQGTGVNSWPSTAGTTYCWQDPKAVHFELVVPPGIAGTLRLRFVEGDGMARRQKVLVQGKVVGEFAGFGAMGKTVEMPVKTADTKDGKIDVVLANLLSTGTAVVSTVEFVPAPVK